MPWLCTWAGDPTLVEVALTGFLGVRPQPGGLQVTPQLPQAWAGRELRAAFWCRGAQWRLIIDPDLEPGVILRDGEPVTGTTMTATAPNHELRVAPAPHHPDKET